MNVETCFAAGGGGGRTGRDDAGGRRIVGREWSHGYGCSSITNSSKHNIYR